MTNHVADEMWAHYRRTIERSHDSTHYEDCWRGHWLCALEKALDEIGRLHATVQYADRVRFSARQVLQSAQLDPLKEIWTVGGSYLRALETQLELEQPIKPRKGL